MFFQLSLPSTSPGNDAGDEPARRESHGPDTLTLPAVHVAGRAEARPVARIRLAPARGARGSLRVGVAAAPRVTVTYTADRADLARSELPLQ